MLTNPVRLYPATVYRLGAACLFPTLEGFEVRLFSVKPPPYTPSNPAPLTVAFTVAHALDKRRELFRAEHAARLGISHDPYNRPDKSALAVPVPAHGCFYAVAFEDYGTIWRG